MTWFSLAFAHTSASVPKAQNSQRLNSDMPFKFIEKLKQTQKQTYPSCPRFCIPSNKASITKSPLFWQLGKQKSQEKFYVLCSNIPTYKLKNVKESIQVTMRKCSTSQDGRILSVEAVKECLFKNYQIQIYFKLEENNLK